MGMVRWWGIDLLLGTGRPWPWDGAGGFSACPQRGKDHGDVQKGVWDLLSPSRSPGPQAGGVGLKPAPGQDHASGHDPEVKGSVIPNPLNRLGLLLVYF